MKKLLAIFITVVMVIGVMPVLTFAEGREDAENAAALLGFDLMTTQSKYKITRPINLESDLVKNLMKEYGCSVEWSTESESVTISDGKADVVRGTTPTQASLTATITSSEGFVETKTIDFIIAPNTEYVYDTDGFGHDELLQYYVAKHSNGRWSGGGITNGSAQIPYTSKIVKNGDDYIVDNNTEVNSSGGYSTNYTKYTLSNIPESDEMLLEFSMSCEDDPAWANSGETLYYDFEFYAYDTNLKKDARIGYMRFTRNPTGNPTIGVSFYGYSDDTKTAHKATSYGATRPAIGTEVRYGFKFNYEKSEVEFYMDGVLKKTFPAFDTASIKYMQYGALRFGSPSRFFFDDLTVTIPATAMDEATYNKCVNADKVSYVKTLITEKSITSQKKDLIKEDLTLNNFTIPADCSDVNVAWTSSHPSVIAVDGKVTRPEERCEVTLTATISAGEGDTLASDTKTFTYTVLGADEEEQIIDGYYETGTYGENITGYGSCVLDNSYQKTMTMLKGGWVTLEVLTFCPGDYMLSGLFGSKQPTVLNVYVNDILNISRAPMEKKAVSWVYPVQYDNIGTLTLKSGLNVIKFQVPSDSGDYLGVQKISLKLVPSFTIPFDETSVKADGEYKINYGTGAFATEKDTAAFKMVGGNDKSWIEKSISVTEEGWYGFYITSLCRDHTLFKFTVTNGTDSLTAEPSDPTTRAYYKETYMGKMYLTKGTHTIRTIADVDTKTSAFATQLRIGALPDEIEGTGNDFAVTDGKAVINTDKAARYKLSYDTDATASINGTVIADNEKVQFAEGLNTVEFDGTAPAKLSVVPYNDFAGSTANIQLGDKSLAANDEIICDIYTERALDAELSIMAKGTAAVSASVSVNGKEAIASQSIGTPASGDNYGKMNFTGTVSLEKGHNRVRILVKSNVTVGNVILTDVDADSDETIITSFELQKEDGERAPLVITGGLKTYASVTVKKGGNPTGEDYTVIVAQYAGNKLLNVSKENISVAGMANCEEKEFRAELTLIEGADTVKAFLIGKESIAPAKNSISTEPYNIFSDETMHSQTVVVEQSEDVKDHDGNNYPSWDVASSYGTIDAVFYTGYDGTKVFAYVGIPSGASAENPVPAVVCVHGSGGVADSSAVENWMKRGFAAISMDLYYGTPVKWTSSMDTSLKGDNGRVKHPFAGTAPWNGTYNFYAEDYTKAGQYGAMWNLSNAITLLSDMEEIDEKNIGMIGVSWGGVMMTLAMGEDPRLKFGIPVYGTGYLDLGTSYFNKYCVNGKEQWDPAAHMAKSAARIMVMNSDSDNYFSLRSSSATASVGKNSFEATFHRWGHSEQAAYAKEQIYNFAKGVVGGYEPFILIDDAKCVGSELVIDYTVPENITFSQAELYYLKDTEYPTEENISWRRTVEYTNDGSTLTFDIPSGATFMYVSITDTDGNVVSTRLFDLR